MIDLHVHSNVSDGEYSPEELVDRAKEMGLEVFAVADHDSTEGSARAMARGKEMGLEVVPALELTTAYLGKPLHILGYYIDLENEDLAKALQEVRQYRVDRAKMMVEKINSELAAAGKEQVFLQKILDGKGDSPVTSGDIAMELLHLGHTQTRQEAYDRWLNKYNVAIKDFTVKEAIDVIHKAGGVAVLAHPNSTYLSLKIIVGEFEEQVKVIQEFVGYGLDGIEAYREEHSLEDEMRYIKLAADLGVLVTGGSDYHGKGASVETGNQIASVKVPDEVVEQLKAAVKMK